LSALTALGKIGPDAQEAVSAIARLLEEKDRTLRWQVLAALGNIGPGAREAMSELIKLLGESTQIVRDGNIFLAYDKETHEKVTDVLAKIGKDIITPLGRELNNSNDFIRLGAADALGKIGPDAKRMAQSLEYVYLHDKVKQVRDAAKDAYFKVTAKKIAKPKTKPKSSPKK
jgi:HEAT repeat protein